jgi:hypothetical protein
MQTAMAEINPKGQAAELTGWQRQMEGIVSTIHWVDSANAASLFRQSEYLDFSAHLSLPHSPYG